MTIQQDIDSLKGRISKAEYERDAWRGAGLQEQYLAAYVLVEALEIQLWEKLRTPRHDLVQ